MLFFFFLFWSGLKIPFHATGSDTTWKSSHKMLCECNVNVIGLDMGQRRLFSLGAWRRPACKETHTR
jgi:hypothetical protein